nr:hypothetical protein [Tanacetum cinerariifolium]
RKARAAKRAPETLEVADRHFRLTGLVMAVGMHGAWAAALVNGGRHRRTRTPVPRHLRHR